MQKTLIGLFDERGHVESVVDRLRDEGFDAKDISIVMRNKEDAQEVESNTGADVAGGAVSGATTGAIIGGLAGLVAAVAIPGLGAFFIGGPIAAALGLTGAAATTASGAVTGALAGGLLGALTGLGLSEDEARHYESAVEQGAILVAVPVTGQNESYVRDLFEEHNAYDIRSLTQRGDAYEDVEDTSYVRTHHGAGSDMHYYAGMKGGKAHQERGIDRRGETADVDSDK